jgi:hypothetical protein
MSLYDTYDPARPPQNFTQNYVQSALTVSDPAQLYQERVHRKQIHLRNPERTSNARRERDQRRQRKQQEASRKQLGPTGMKRETEKGLWKLSKDECRCVIDFGILSG